jgi:glucose/arabinose dehydrogenase
MKYRHLLVLGLLGAAGMVGTLGACNDGDDDDDSADAGDAGKLSDGGTLVGDSGSGTDATIADGGTQPGTDAAPADAASTYDAALVIPDRCNGTTKSANNPPSSSPSPAPAITVPEGLTLEAIGTLPGAPGARELVALPNGDLLVASSGTSVYFIANADNGAADTPSTPTIFATFPESPAQGISYDPTTCTIYVATEHDIYAIPYTDAQQTATPGSAIATVRPQAPEPGTDGDNHTSTSLAAVPNGQLYAGVGSDCNACVETDPTRATVQQLALDGGATTTRATRVRNAIGLAVNPSTGTVWAGGAGQDDLPLGHPYEWFDGVTLHPGTPDYGWPACEENQHAYIDGSVCTSVVEPRIELPAYSTIIGATFYPTGGVYNLGSTYQGGVFITSHGSWHKEASSNTYYTSPKVVFVPMNGDTPVTAVDWTDPTKQWTTFIDGFQPTGDTRIGKPTGIAVGPLGSLFVADDQTNQIYRVRHYAN